MTKKRKLPVSYRNSLRSSSIKGIVLAAAQHRGATYWAIVGLVSLVLVFFFTVKAKSYILYEKFVFNSEESQFTFNELLEQIQGE